MPGPYRGTCRLRTHDDSRHGKAPLVPTAGHAHPHHMQERNDHHPCNPPFNAACAASAAAAACKQAHEQGWGMLGANSQCGERQGGNRTRRTTRVPGCTFRQRVNVVAGLQKPTRPVVPVYKHETTP
jgi:hypothetical protein